MMLTSSNIDKKAANRFGTPLFLYDLSVVRKKYFEVRNNLTASCEIFYSMKANPSLAVCEFIKTLGSNCEVSSKNELLTALQAGFQSEQIIFVGPGKKEDDIELAIVKRIKFIVCESIDEIQTVNKLSKKHNRTTSILIRINPDFAVVNAPIKMGGVSSQFGIESNVLIKNIKTIWQCRHISFSGIHVYNASRVLDFNSIVSNIEKILLLVTHLSDQCGIEWEYVDFGGGFGVPYYDNEKYLDICSLLSTISDLLNHYRYHHPKINFILELGRFLVAESGHLLSRVRSVKRTHNKNYVIVDAGMHCHMASVGLGSFVHRNFPCEVIDRKIKNNHDKNIYQIVGPSCTPNDLLLKDIELPTMCVGDLIKIGYAGAYGLTASPGRFLSHGIPAEATYFNDTLYLIRHAELLTDILSKQVSLKKIYQSCREKKYDEY